MGFKILFLTDMVLCLLSYLLGDLFYYFPNLISLTVDRLQLWRLVTSFMLPSIGQFAIINALFEMYILYQFLPEVVTHLSLRKKDCPLLSSSSSFSCRSSSATWS
jgi:hypothetical protein